MILVLLCLWVCAILYSETGQFVSVDREMFIKSCSFRNDWRLVILLCESLCLYGTFKIKLYVAKLCLNRGLDETSCCFIFCDVWEVFCVSTSHNNTMVRNAFSAVVYTHAHYAHLRKPHCCAFCQLRNFFPLLLHE